MSKSAGTAEWLPLMDYAIKTGVSLSTLRRHIKSNKILHKVEDGRYLLYYSGPDHDEREASPVNKTDDTSAIVKLNSDLNQAREEIAELKTLIAFYEEQLPKHALDV